MRFVIFSLFLCIHVFSASALASLESNFFSERKTITAKISPSGAYVAVLRSAERAYDLMLYEVKADSTKMLMNTKDYAREGAYISNLTWIGNQYLAIQFSEPRSGIEYLYDTKRVSKLLLLDTRKPIEDANAVLSLRTKGRLVNALPENDFHILYAKNSSHSKVYRIDVTKLDSDKKRLKKTDKVDGGQFNKSNEIKTIDGFALKWFFDEKNNVDAVLHFDSSGKAQLTEFEGSDRKTINLWPKKNKKNKKNEKNQGVLFFPLKRTKDKNTYYSFDLKSQEKKSIYEVDFSKNESKIVYQTSAFEIVDVIISPERELMGVAVLKDGAIDYEYIDNRNAKLSSNSSGSSNLISLFDVSLDKDIMLMYAEKHNKPGEFFYIDKRTDTKISIGHAYSGINKEIESRQIKGEISVDDLAIPYIVNFPKKKDGGHALPLIVMPHGGPFGVYDTPYFDHVTQYFVSQRYAVLRVNYRGSGGYTKRLKESGKGEWGGKIISDIYQATMHVASLKEIDKSNICSLGFSYGGYAAITLTHRYPQVFKCAASVGGVMDLNLYVFNSSTTEPKRKWFDEYIGNPLEDYDALKSISPVSFYGEISNPILIAHGREDRVVDVEHAFRMKMMLDKNKKKFDFYIDDIAGHHFSKVDSKIALFNRLSTFLNQYLGG